MQIKKNMPVPPRPTYDMMDVTENDMVVIIRALDERNTQRSREIADAIRLRTGLTAI